MATGTPLRPELFHSSPYNFDPGVVADEALRLSLTVADVTLREGQQAAEIAFSEDDETALARELVDAGVPVIQVGFAGTDDATVRRIRDACPDVRIAVIVVGWKDDAVEAMASARRAGADVCSILVRAGQAHLANLGLTHAEAIARMNELTRHAVDAGYNDVVCAPSFGTVAELDFLMRLYSEGLAAGATAISLADSGGVAKPAAIAFLVSRMRSLAGDAGVRVHMHNDFGLAVANTLAGIAAGADWADATVNGLGERAGNCPLEELVVALEALYGVDVGIRTEKLTGLSRTVSRLSGAAIPPMKPVVGGDVFSNKLEIHVKASVSNPALMEPFDPAAVGGRRTVRLGKGTGPTGIAVKLSELGLALDSALVEPAVARIGELARRNGRGVSDTEFRDLVAELGAGTGAS